MIEFRPVENLAEFIMDDGDKEALLLLFLQHIEDYLDDYPRLCDVYKSTADDKKLYFSKQLIQSFESLKNETILAIIEKQPHLENNETLLLSLKESIHRLSIGLIRTLIPYLLGNEYRKRKIDLYSKENDVYRDDLGEIQNQSIVSLKTDYQNLELDLFEFSKLGPNALKNSKYDNIFNNAFDYISNFKPELSKTTKIHISKRISLDIITFINEHVALFPESRQKAERNSANKILQYIFPGLVRQFYSELFETMSVMMRVLELESQRKAIFEAIKNVLGETQDFKAKDPMFVHIASIENLENTKFSAVFIDSEAGYSEKIEKYLESKDLEYKIGGLNGNAHFEVYLKNKEVSHIGIALEIYNDLIREFDLSLTVDLIPFGYDSFKSVFEESNLSRAQIIQNIVCKRIRRKHKESVLNKGGFYVDGIDFSGKTLFDINGCLGVNKNTIEDIPTTPVEYISEVQSSSENSKTDFHISETTIEIPQDYPEDGTNEQLAQNPDTLEKRGLSFHDALSIFDMSKNQLLGLTNIDIEILSKRHPDLSEEEIVKIYLKKPKLSQIDTTIFKTPQRNTTNQKPALEKAEKRGWTIHFGENG